MAPEDTEELVDYDEAEEAYVPPATTEAAPAGTEVAAADGEKKGSYVGIHSTGFR